MKVIAYTDGACSGNPGPGAWAALFRKDEKEHLFTGYVSRTTNNRMELQAVIEVLKEIKAGGEREVKIVSDSEYVVFGITGKHKRRANKDLWNLLEEALEGMKVEWERTSSNLMQYKCDKIARRIIGSKKR